MNVRRQACRILRKGLPFRKTLPLLLWVYLAGGSAVALAGPIDGFTEPYRRIEIAAAETGIITEIQVREGDTVRRGQVLATLDRDVLLALLAIAEQSMNLRGRLESALAELELRQARLGKLEILRSNGHARQEEVERARADLAIAQAQVLSAREDLLIKKLEHHKIQAQIQRRTLRAPIDGVIAKIQKDEGEYVAPNDPYILTLVQLDPLLATFSVMSDRATQLTTGQKVILRTKNVSEVKPRASVSMKGIVEFIAPVTDAESGTVRVKVRIDNPEGRYRSGEKCTLELPVANQHASR